MAAKIGILGETTTVPSADTLTTLYTVPADKAARVRVLARVINAAVTLPFRWLIGSPGNERTIAVQLTSGVDYWTGLDDQINAGRMEVRESGIFILSAGLGNTPTDPSSTTFVIAPLALDYYLSTGDTVRFLIDTQQPSYLLLQVHGVEDDA